MARQKKRKDGYLCKTFTFNDKRYFIYGRTADDLLRNEIKKRKELEEGEEALLNPSLNSYYEHFSDIRRNEIRESTMRSQKIQFNVISNAVVANGRTFGEMHIKEITRRNIEDVRSQLLAEGNTPHYLNNCFAHLNHVFNSAVLDDTLNKNPCKALKPLKREIPLIGENKHRALSVEETKAFFKAAEESNSYYLNACIMLIKTGLRIGELAALYEPAVEVDNSRVKLCESKLASLSESDIEEREKVLCESVGNIHVKRTVVRNESGDYGIGEYAKTRSGLRDVPLTYESYLIVKEQRKTNHTLFGLIVNDRIFKSAEGKILREYAINREIKRICKRSGIEDFTCHAFRNTFATRFIEQRPQDYKILSEILGHKDVKITLNLYTHVMTENKVSAMEGLRIKVS